MSLRTVYWWTAKETYNNAQLRSVIDNRETRMGNTGKDQRKSNYEQNDLVCECV